MSTTVEAPTQVGRSWTAWLRDNGVYAALVLLLLFNLVFTANFMTVGNFRTQLIQASPIIVVAAGVVAVVMAFVVRRTTFGRQLVAVGGNRRASELSGLPVKRILLGTYVISGLLAAVAGILATSRLQASDPSTIGLLFELYAITAVVVGGTPLSGGKVRVLGTIAGALLMQLIDATLVKHNISDSWSQITQAVIIIAAVYLQLDRGRKG